MSQVQSSTQDGMDMDPSPLSTNGINASSASKHVGSSCLHSVVFQGQSNTNAKSITESEYQPSSTSNSHANSDLGSPQHQHQNSHSASAIQQSASHLSHVVNFKPYAEQTSLTVPTHQRHAVDRNAHTREEKGRLERLMSSDDEQDSLLDPSQGVTSLMDMMQLVQLTKTEKSTKTRQVILAKIIQTDDIALLQKYLFDCDVYYFIVHGS
jgi:hypothetical protein